MTTKELKGFLDFKAEYYNNHDFIATDPIQIPHRFIRKEDIEISGFLVATIAWGNRKSILKSGNRMMELMGGTPYDFVMEAKEEDLCALKNFKHRTFNGEDFNTFIRGLQHIYTKHGGMEGIFTAFSGTGNLQDSIHEFRKLFFEVPHLKRTEKHVSDPYKNSAAKRINMFLRWMVRRDEKGVDFGLWKQISPSELSCPLDVHSGRVARKLGLLTRKQNDAKAVKELDVALRELAPEDPVKYDFALYGLGAFENF